MRLAEAEAKLKTEVARLKKKYQAQITELELSLDAANKANIDLQKTIKKQALQITVRSYLLINYLLPINPSFPLSLPLMQELQAHYDEVHRQLQQAVDQLGVTQRRCQALTAELEEMRVNLEQAQRAKRAAEQLHEEAVVRVNELTTINVNLASAKSKLETEFSALQNDYDEVHKELRVSHQQNFWVEAFRTSFSDHLLLFLLLRSPTSACRS